MLERTNRDFYEPLWGESQLIAPERFNTWPLVESLLRADSRCRKSPPACAHVCRWQERSS